MRACAIYLLFINVIKSSSAWISPRISFQLKREIVETCLVSSIFFTQSLFLPLAVPVSYAIDTNININNIISQSNTDISTKVLSDTSFSQTLKPATESQPQIILPKGAEILPQPVGKKNPIVQGLVFLRDPQNARPDFTDVLVVTVSSAISSPDEILVGAKIPITKVKFPTQLNLYTENILPSKLKEWESVISNKEDLNINVWICPESDTKTGLPCSLKDSTFQASGISKVVKNLPGMEEGDIVRTAASLGL